jgi:hypothetical protein
VFANWQTGHKLFIRASFILLGIYHNTDTSKELLGKISFLFCAIICKFLKINFKLVLSPQYWHYKQQGIIINDKWVNMAR